MPVETAGQEGARMAVTLATGRDPLLPLHVPAGKAGTEGVVSPKYADRRTRQTSLTLHEGDLKLVVYGAEWLGSSKSDFIRAAIRSYASQLQQLDRRTK